MSTPTKVEQTDLFPLTAVVTAGQYLPAPGAGVFNTTSKMACGFMVHFAPVSLQAAPAATEWGIEKKILNSVNRYEAIYSRFSLDTVPAAGPPTVSSGAAAGTNTCVVSSATGLVAGMLIFFKNATFTSSEWKKIVGISGTTLTFRENFEATQTASTIYTGAEAAYLELDITVIKNGIRFFVDNNKGPSLGLTNRDIAIRCSLETLDSFD